MMYLSNYKNKEKHGQHLVEYVLLLSLVLAGIVIMGPYVIRSWNAKIKGWDDSVIDSFQDPHIEGNVVIIDPPVCIPIDGGWSPWTVCSGIGPDCTQTRTCTEPVPNACGANCEGPIIQSCTGGDCIIDPCEPIDGGWTPWSPCAGIPPNCVQSRTCSNPWPNACGAPCVGPTQQDCTCICEPSGTVCDPTGGPGFPDCFNCCNGWAAQDTSGVLGVCDPCPGACVDRSGICCNAPDNCFGSDCPTDGSPPFGWSNFYCTDPDGDNRCALACSVNCEN